MTLLAIAFIAGALTVLAPCILPLLPVVIGTSLSGRSRLTPYVVVASLCISIIVFTYVLKVSTVFISVPQSFWVYFSGGIVFLFGLSLLWPSIWERIPGLGKISVRANKLLGTGHQKHNFWGDVLVGADLGPIFSTCSPTYFVILATVLPSSFLIGSIYLLAYVLGLALILLLIALLGEKFAGRLGTYANPNGWFKKTLGALFIVLGIMIAFGFEKKIETAILDSGYFDITKIEQKLLEKI